MSDASQSAGLPPNWRSVTSEDGRVYYYNKITRETRWDRPVLSPQPVALPPPPPPLTIDANAQPPPAAAGYSHPFSAPPVSFPHHMDQFLPNTAFIPAPVPAPVVDSQTGGGAAADYSHHQHLQRHHHHQVADPASLPPPDFLAHVLPPLPRMSWTLSISDSQNFPDLAAAQAQAQAQANGAAALPPLIESAHSNSLHMSDVAAELPQAQKPMPTSYANAESGAFHPRGQHAVDGAERTACPPDVAQQHLLQQLADGEEKDSVPSSVTTSTDNLSRRNVQSRVASLTNVFDQMNRPRTATVPSSTAPPADIVQPRQRTRVVSNDPAARPKSMIVMPTHGGRPGGASWKDAAGRGGHDHGELTPIASLPPPLPLELPELDLNIPLPDYPLLGQSAAHKHQAEQQAPPPKRLAEGELGNFLGELNKKLSNSSGSLLSTAPPKASPQIVAPAPAPPAPAAAAAPVNGPNVNLQASAPATRNTGISPSGSQTENLTIPPDTGSEASDSGSPSVGVSFFQRVRKASFSGPTAKKDKEGKDGKKVRDGEDSPIEGASSGEIGKSGKRTRSPSNPPMSLHSVANDDWSSSGSGSKEKVAASGSGSGGGSGFSRLFKGRSGSPASDKSANAGALAVSATANSKEHYLFGGLLTTLAVNGVPPIVVQCTNYIEAKAIRMEGIYRLSGNAAQIQRLRSAFMQPFGSEAAAMSPSAAAATASSAPVPLLENGQPDVTSFDVHVASSTLKLFFRELQEPLLVADLYPEWIAAGKLAGQARKDRVRALIARLPAAHWYTLGHLMQHLHRLSEHSEHSKMDATNLSIVFGPTLIKPKIETVDVILNTDAQNSVVQEMIAGFADLFGASPIAPPGLASAPTPPAQAASPAYIANPAGATDAPHKLAGIGGVAMPVLPPGGVLRPSELKGAQAPRV